MLLKNKFHVSLCYNVQQALRKDVTSFVPVIRSYITVVLYVLLVVADCYLLLIAINCFVLTVVTKCEVLTRLIKIVVILPIIYFV